MRRIVFVVIGLLALFTLLRLHAAGGDEAGETKETRFLIHPGVVEFEGEESGARIAFGFLEHSGPGGQGRTWNIFPIRISLRSGGKRFSLGLNGLSFITRSGLKIGKPIHIRNVEPGDIISIGGEVTIEGTVQGDVWTLGANIILLPGAVVTGDVVTLGGTIEADKRSHIKGNKQALPDIKIPFLGLLTSDNSAGTIYFLIEVLGIFLFLILLFLAVHFFGNHLTGLNGVLASQWQGSLLYLVLALLLLPAIVLLLVSSIVGIILIPFVFIILIVLAVLGYLAAAVRLGRWIRRRGEDESGLFIFTSGLLGLLVIKGPAVLGILLSLLTSDLLKGIGRFLVSVSSIFMAAAVLYGLGGALKYLRIQAKS